MKGIEQMKKNYGYPKLEIICKASAGNETTIKGILKFYDAYICKLCLCPFYHSESSKITMQVDEELKGQIHTEMMKAILKFEIRMK
ncbi:TPA: helix-turn-helix domain-containing protein [Clostridioides difficile]